MYENVTWCKSAGNSRACHFKSAQTGCGYFGVFGYKQRDTMKWRFDKYRVLLGNLEITSKEQLFTSAFNWASMLAVWHPNSGSSCKPVRAQGHHPEGRCEEAKPATCLVKKDHPMSERGCLKAIRSHKIQFYFEDNIPIKRSTCVQFHVGSGFETLKQAKSAKFNCYSVIYSGVYFSESLMLPMTVTVCMETRPVTL